MLKSKFCDGKNVAVIGRQRLFGGIPVRRSRGMIYWYSWGRHTFDIRVLRRVLGVEEEIKADKWFMEQPADEKGSFEEQMNHLSVALGSRDMREAIKAHDKILNGEAEIELKERAARIARAKELTAHAAATAAEKKRAPALAGVDDDDDGLPF